MGLKSAGADLDGFEGEDDASLLIIAGADLDTLYGPDKFSSLAAAVLKGHTDIALFLIQSGAEVNNKDVRGFTAAHNAAQEGNLVVLKALAEAGADLDVKGRGLSDNSTGTCYCV